MTKRFAPARFVASVGFTDPTQNVPILIVVGNQERATIVSWLARTLVLDFMMLH
ncbi:MAG: hypothetical protein HFJ66_07355 [Eggerthellaceae bacterium]|nr:hypothetical protein [Eggerthellaceae bacterium]